MFHNVTMFDSLPEALVEEIVQSLPLKSIGKCMLVCRSWHAMINSHNFISSHLQHSLINPSPPLFLFRDVFCSCKEQYFLYSSSFQRIAEYSFSPPLWREREVFGALNGVVCLSDYYTHNIVLLNPLIGKELQLPKSISTCRATTRTIFGFGFDSKKNDFKVVRVCCVDGGGSVVAPMVELYSLEEGAWRIIDASYLELLDLRIGHFWKQLFFHDNVHWLACDSLQCNCILTFNVVEEKFEKMELPEKLATTSYKLVMSVIEGCLSIIEYSSFSICRIWSRRESWIYSEGGFVQLMELRAGVGAGAGKGLCASSDFTESLVLLDKGSNVVYLTYA